MSQRNDTAVRTSEADAYIRHMESTGWTLDYREDGDDGMAALVFKRDD